MQCHIACGCSSLSNTMGEIRSSSLYNAGLKYSFPFHQTEPKFENWESKCLLRLLLLGTLCMRINHLGLWCRSMLRKQLTCWTFLSTYLPTVLTSPVSNQKKKRKAIRPSRVVSNTWNHRKYLWDVKIEVTARAAYTQPWWVRKIPQGYKAPDNHRFSLRCWRYISCQEAKSWNKSNMAKI